LVSPLSVTLVTNEALALATVIPAPDPSGLPEASVTVKVLDDVAAAPVASAGVAVLVSPASATAAVNPAVPASPRLTRRRWTFTLIDLPEMGRRAVTDR
jgi:hypothetical protein